MSEAALQSPRRSFSSHYLSLRLMNGQGERERRTLADGARQPDLSAVQFDELLRQRKAKTRTLRFALRVSTDLAKFLEHRFAILRRNADAGIGNAHLDCVVRRSCHHRNLSALRGE